MDVSVSSNTLIVGKRILSLLTVFSLKQQVLLQTVAKVSEDQPEFGMG